jgi:hypothetical protein
MEWIIGSFFKEDTVGVIQTKLLWKEQWMNEVAFLKGQSPFLHGMKVLCTD